jgi:hypothetical protein
LWELAYAELIWSPVLWPDADEALLVSTLETFAQRQRRFGQKAPRVNLTFISEIKVLLALADTYNLTLASNTVTL